MANRMNDLAYMIETEDLEGFRTFVSREKDYELLYGAAIFLIDEMMDQGINENIQQKFLMVLLQLKSQIEVTFWGKDWKKRNSALKEMLLNRADRAYGNKNEKAWRFENPVYIRHFELKHEETLKENQADQDQSEDCTERFRKIFAEHLNRKYELMNLYMDRYMDIVKLINMG